MRNKYGARKCKCDGEVFDSHAELCRWKELKILEKAGKIKKLRRQVKYLLIPSQYTMEKSKRGYKKKMAERECTYVADFVYHDAETDEMVVEDVKGGKATKTDAYKIKRKLMLYVHGIKITEVER